MNQIIRFKNSLYQLRWNIDVFDARTDAYLGSLAPDSLPLVEACSAFGYDPADPESLLETQRVGPAHVAVLQPHVPEIFDLEGRIYEFSVVSEPLDDAAAVDQDASPVWRLLPPPAQLPAIFGAVPMRSTGGRRGSKRRKRG
jgi:hypothetical protein